jgi:hypothetical protein
MSRSERASESAHDIYPFSLEPARIAGLVWPNVYGDRFTGNCSWFEFLPPRGRHARLWLPSLYLGGLTLVLALGTLGFRGRSPQQAWLSAIAVISLVASLGEYSSSLWWLRWVPAIAREVGPHDPTYTDAIRNDAYLRDGDGGVYWALATVFPGFGQFRYPSKLITLTTLALTALAGLGWDRVSRERCRWTLGVTWVLLALTGAGWILVTVYRGMIVNHWSSLITTQLASQFGPPDTAGAYRVLWWSLVQTLIVLGLTAILLTSARRAPILAGLAALVITSADLAVANTRYVVTVPQRVMDAEPHVWQTIAEAERRDPAGQPYRVHRMRYWEPRLWLEEPADTDRRRQIITWNRDTLEAKYGIPYGLQYTDTASTIELENHRAFFRGYNLVLNDEGARRLDMPPGAPIHYLPRRSFDLWNTRYFVLPVVSNGWSDPYRAYSSLFDQTDPIEPARDAFIGPDHEARLVDWIRHQDFQVVRNRRAFPRTWVVHQARFHPPIATMSRADRSKLFEEIRYAADPFWYDPTRRVWDPRVLAWVEADHQVELAGYLPGSVPQSGESVTIAQYTPQRVEIDAILQRPGLVILADVDYPGWRLTIDGAPARIYRTNVLMRGAAVPSGKHHLVYSYQPRSFTVGLWTSAAGLIALAALASRAGLRVLRAGPLPSP